jgi:hypothetical protein
MGHVECPQSESANNDLQPGRTWMVAATNCERVGDQSRNGRRYLRLAKPAISIVGSEEGADRKPAISITGERAEATHSKPAISIAGVGAGRRSRCESLAEVIGAKLEAGLSARRIYQDLVEQNDFGDSYQSVQRFVRKLKATQPRRVWRMEARPGEEVQVDFGLGAPIDDGASRLQCVYLQRAFGCVSWYNLERRSPATAPPRAQRPDVKEVALRVWLADGGVRDLPGSGNSSDAGEALSRSPQ